MRRPGSAAGVPLICVGNPPLGGAGKTPAALAIGRFLKAAGERPFFLSRGYGGRARGPLVVDPGRHGAREVGDEPLLLARLEIQLERTQALIAVGEIAAAACVLAKAEARGIPVFRGRLEPDAQALAALAGKDVLAFAGIADPQKRSPCLCRSSSLQRQGCGSPPRRGGSARPRAGDD